MRNLLRRLRPRYTDRDVLTLSRENRRLAGQAEADAEIIADLAQRLDIARHANVAAAHRILTLSAELQGLSHQLAARDVMIDEAEREIEALRSAIDESIAAHRLALIPAPVAR